MPTFAIAMMFLSAFALAGCNGSKKVSDADAASSSATISQTDGSGTTTTRQTSEDGQTITRQSGNNSATITQSP